MKQTLTIIIALFLLMSCEPEPFIDEGTERIEINPENLDTYKFTDWGTPDKEWVERKNGDRYTFYIEDNTVYITSEEPMIEASVTGSDSYLKISVDNGIKTKINDVTFFKIKY